MVMKGDLSRRVSMEDKDWPAVHGASQSNKLAGFRVFLTMFLVEHTSVNFQGYFFAFFSEDICYGLNAAAFESHLLRKIRI